MSFCQSVMSSAIGAFIGFLGAIVVFFIKEWWQNANRNKSIIENLKLELTYNINLYEKCEAQIQECIEAISSDSRTVYLNLDYNFVGTYFAKQFYNNGLLLKYFHPEDMRRWNVMLTQIGAGAENHVIDCVDQWREKKEINKDVVYNALKHEKRQVAYAKEMSQYILQKL